METQKIQLGSVQQKSDFSQNSLCALYVMFVKCVILHNVVAL